MASDGMPYVGSETEPVPPAPVVPQPDPVVPPPVDPSGADRYWQQVARSDEARLRYASKLAAERDVDRVVRAQKAAERWKLPVDFAERNLDVLEGHAAITERQARTLLRHHPELAEWMSNPDNAVIAKDDLGALRQIDAAVRRWQDPDADPAGLLPDGFTFGPGGEILEVLPGGMATVVGGFDDLDRRLDQIATDQSELEARTPGRFMAGFRGSVAATGNLFGFRQDQALQAQGDLQASAYLEPSFWSDVVRGAGGLAADVPLMFAGGPVGRGARFLQQQLFFRKAPIPILSRIANTGGRMSQAINVAAAGTPLAVREGAEGGPIAWLIETVIPGSFGATGVERVLLGASAEAVAKDRVHGLARRVLAGSTWEGSEEATTELAHALHEAAAGDATALDPDRLVRRLGVASILGAAAGAGFTLPAEVGRDLHDRAQAAQRALASRDGLAGIIAAARASQSGKQSPGALRDLIDSLGGDAKQVFFQADDWDAYWQSKGVDPAKAADLYGARDAYLEARAHGGEMPLPVGKIVEAALGDQVGPAADGLLDLLRREPGAPSAAEAKVWVDGIPAEIEQLATAAAREVQAPDQDSAVQVKADVVEQMTAAGFDAQTAEQYGTLYESVFRSLATRTGQDPAALYQRYALQIRRALPAALQGREKVDALDSLLDRLRAGQIPQDQEIFGTSLLEFLREGGLQDQGGELSHMDADAGRKAFQRKLIREDGRGLDDARAVAIERGYLPEGATINDLLAAIREELAGRPVYNRDNANPAQQDLRDALTEIRAALADAGIDLATADNATAKRALMGGADAAPLSEAAQRVLNQPAYHGSPHEFDRFTTAKMGTGEGHQAFGWGLYFAGRKEVAAWYRDTISRNRRDADPELQAAWKALATQLKSDDYLGFNTAAQAVSALRSHPDWRDRWESLNPDVLQSALDAYQKLAKELAGKIYTVEIPDDAQYLLWDKPLRAQPPEVRSAVEAVLAANPEAAKLLGADPDHPVDGTLGEGFYQTLSQALGGDEAASRALAAAGVSGIKYLDGTSRGSGDGSYNYVVFDESAIRIVQYEQGDDDTKRGQIAFGPDRRFAITLFQKADLSTFLHESGHLYLEVLGDLAQDPNAPEALRTDYAAILAWLGVDSRDAIGTPQHEQFARGFEAYLMEGKAPNGALRRAFARFRAWLVQIYRDIRGLKVELNPEIRQVFDRLVAAEDEITAAELRAGVQPVWTTPEQAGMTAQQFAEYQASVEDAKREALDDLVQEHMTEVRRERTRQYQLARAKLRVEVEAEVNQRREYVALSILQRGVLPDGRPLPEGQAPFKLDRQAIVEADWGGDALLKRLPRPWVYTRDAGVHPDTAAEVLGFRSGEELVFALANARPRQQVIDAETDVRLREQFGDLLTDGSVADKALRAVHNEKRGELLVQEARRLGTRAGRKPAPHELLKRAAEATIAKQRVRDLRPDLYRLAQARAARQAFEAAAKGDHVAAFEAKQREILNHELFRQAAKAREASEKAGEHLRTFDDPKVRGRIGKAGGWEWTVRLPDGRAVPVASEEEARRVSDAAGGPQVAPWERTSSYLDQIDHLLERFELRRQTNRRLRDRERLRDWLRAREIEGAVSAIPESLLDEADRRNWRDLTVEELTGLRDAVANIETMARLKNRLSREAEQRELRQMVTEAIGTIRENVRKRPARARSGDATGVDDASDRFASFVAAHRKLASLAREMDGGKDGGVLWSLFVRPLNEAGDAEVESHKAAAKAVRELWDTWTKAGGKPLSTTVDVPGIDRPMTLETRLAVALNWGNAGNRERLLVGEGWEAAQAEAVLATLEHHDWVLVQGLLDHVDSYWSEIAAKQQRVTGVAPEKVEATPIETRYGVFRGGYYPVKYDPGQSARSATQEAATAAHLYAIGQATKATTRRGHTEARQQGTGNPLRLDLDVVAEHLSQVIHDLTHHEVIIDLNRLLGQEALIQTIQEHMGPAALRQIVDTVRSVAVSDLADGEPERLVRWVRNGVSVASLGFNVSSVLMQITGVGQSMARVGAARFARAIGRVFHDPGRTESAIEFIRSRSSFMRNRVTTANREAREVFQDMRGGAWKQRLHQAAYYLMLRAQLAVDMPTWLAGYEGALEEGADEAKAVAIADQAVIDSQGSGMTKDLSGVQRQRYLQLFTVFYSPFAAMFNLSAESVARFRRAGLTPGSSLRLAADFLLIYALPAAMATAIRRLLKGDDDEERTFLGDTAREAAGAALGTIVIGREFSNVLLTGRPYGGPAGTMGLDALADLIVQAHQGELDDALVRALVKTAGVWFHLPTQQVVKSTEGLIQATEDGDLRQVIFGPKR